MDTARKEKERATGRELSSAAAGILKVISIIFSLYSIMYLIGFFDLLGIHIATVPHRAAHLGLVLAITFLVTPAGFTGRERNRIPWYDIVLIILALVANGYLFLFNEVTEQRVAMGSMEFIDRFLTWTMVIIVLEATRRRMGLVIPLIATVLLLYAFFGSYSPILQTPQYSPDQIARYVGMWADGIYGSILGVSASLVVAFMVFAAFLETSGAANFFVGAARAIMGHVRGGPAKIAVIASALMGTISGSAMGNVATTGSFTIPLMKRTGYMPHFAGAVEAVASNGGQIMPPVMGIAAFVMAEFLGVPFRIIASAAIIPAVLYFLVLFVMVDIEAVKMGLRGLPREDLPKLQHVLGEGIQFVVPLIVLIFLLLVLGYPPQLSALWSAASLVVVSAFVTFVRGKKGHLKLQSIFQALEQGGRSMVDVAVVCAVAGIILGTLNLTGLGLRLSSVLVAASGGHLFVLLVLTALTCILLGMGLPTSGAYILLATLVAPALVKMGMIPLAAHFFIFYFAVAASITPPVAPAAYVAGAIAQANPMQVGWQATRLGIVTFLAPLVFAYNPAFLLVGTPVEIATAAVSALIGSTGLAIGLQGFLFHQCKWLPRILILIGSILAVVPGWKTDVIGIVVLVGAVLWQWKTKNVSIK
ncbi:MAG: TRAP transporter permease [Clostridia bacterium]|nr:MAG: TRAP transporter permease [Clostridia bacterium]